MNELSLLLLLLAVLLFALMGMRWTCNRLDQPAVLGELLLGVLVGNVGVWIGLPVFRAIMHPELMGALAEMPGEAAHAAITFRALAELGAVLLLFSAGLQTSISQLTGVGGRSVLVAVVGVIGPFALAYVSCAWLHKDMTISGHLFTAATLSATSIGITASILKEMRALEDRESQVIFGAAVIDDVLGLLLLAIVSRVATGGTVDLVSIAYTGGLALLFTAALLLIGETASAAAARVFDVVDPRHGQECGALAFAFGAAWVAQTIGLAAIIGAFAAGVVMRNQPMKPGGEGVTARQRASVSTSVAPVERFLAPCFFIFVGMQVDLKHFFDVGTLLLATLFTVCAIVGKLAAGLAAGRDLDRLTVGIGMVPRGEVGLVFLGAGRGLGVVGDEMFASLVIVVFVSTIVTPPSLRWSLCRRKGE